MKVLVLIPARGGSKRLPGKNLLPLGGKPLIAWSIDIVRDLPGVVDVLVSTDDPCIAQVAGEMGAMVPWLRPAELATDTANSVDVALHALDWYEAQHGLIDGLMLLQPTSPLRTRQTVESGIALFQAGQGRAIVGVAPAATHPMWALKLLNGGLQPWVSQEALRTRSQDLPEAYAITGAFYLLSPQELRKERSFFPLDARPLIQNGERESVDIDTEDDYILAQALLSLPVQGSL
jgi:CMP-N,N'-diacetyllegionaminic acid synthase